MTTRALLWDGVEEHPLELSSWSDDNEYVEGRAEVMPSGYRSVADMLSQGVYYTAHRGGGYSYPEMSLQAYTVAVSKGFGALEVSLQRTSDGVFIGCHNPDINEVTGETGLPNVSAMTWAEVQEYQIQPSAAYPNRDPQPFMRVEELFDAYAHTHVIFVDPKNSGTGNYTQLLDLMDSYGGPQRFVGKYFGVGLNTWNTRCHERGYTTWGYFYQEDYDDGDLALWQGQWDMLGMNYSASLDAWGAVLAYEKPVIAHIMQTPEQVNTAASKGANGFTVSNTDSFNFVTSESDLVQRTTWTGTATGKRVPKGSATQVWDVAGTATKRTGGSASSTATWTGSAVGKEPAKGSASTDWSVTGTAAGVRVPKGAASGAFEVTGTAATSSLRVGSASTSFQFDATAVGKSTPKGSASTGADWSGTATAESTYFGYGEQAVNFLGTASGKRVPKSSGTAGANFAGTASGRKSQSGSASTSASFTGTASGVRNPRGSATGGALFAGTASGDAPTLNTAIGAFSFGASASGKRVPKGSGSTSFTCTGSAVGKRIPKGSATITWSVFGQAAGKKHQSGSALGNVMVAGSASGKRKPTGAGQTGFSVSGTASGASEHQGYALGGWKVKGFATGTRASRGSATTGVDWAVTFIPFELYRADMKIYSLEDHILVKALED